MGTIENYEKAQKIKIKSDMLGLPYNFELVEKTYDVKLVSVGNNESNECIIDDFISIIGEKAFYYSSIEVINIPDTVISIEKSAFDSSSVKKINLSKNIKVLGYRILHGCSKLSSLIIPDSVEVIETAALAWSGIKQLEIPDSVTEIQPSAFIGCVKLISIKFPGNLKIINSCVCMECKKLKIVDLPDSITLIGALAFKNCYCLNEISIPNTVSVIGEEAFEECKLEKVYIKRAVNGLEENIEYIKNYFNNIWSGDNKPWITVV